MKTILLVDDELFYRNVIRNMVDWASFGFNVLLEAEDGQEAYDLIKNNLVDIVITDIKMPIIDGIDLIRKASQHTTSINFIALSGYDDFQLVRNAFYEGACDYLLKSEITVHDINIIIQKIVRERVAQCLINDSSYWIDDDISLAFSTLLDGNNSVYAGILSTSSMIEIPDLSSLLSETDIDFEYINLASNLKLFLIPYSGNNRMSNIDKITNCLLKMKKNVESILRVPVLSSYALLDSKPLSSLREGMYALSMEYTEGRGIIHNLDKHHDSMRLLPPPARRLRQWNQWLDNPNEYNAQLASDTLISQHVAYKYWPYDIKELYEGLYNLIISIRKNNNDTVIGDIINDFINIYNTTLDLDRLNEILLLIMRQIVQGASINHYYINEMNRYIQSHYSSNASLSEFAQLLGVSMEHISREITRSTGISFTQYLLQTRLDKAKNLMDNTSMMIYEIAEAVGYTSYENFSKAFKRITGISPSAYMQKKDKH